jgi:DNA recombination protein RmuC
VTAVSIVALASAVVAALAAWALTRAHMLRLAADTLAAQSTAEARREHAELRAADLCERLDTRERELAGLRERAEAASTRAARLEGDLAAAAEKAAVLETAEQRLREAFRALSQEALQQNSDALLRLARASLGEYQTRAVADLEKRQQTIAEIVRPIAETLKHVDGTLGEVEKERLVSSARLDEQMRALGSGLTALTGETGNLVKALRQPHVRGHWGELQLRRVVELAGLVEHCDFAEQQTIATADGRLRPDLLVHLPDGKTIVVDAKAPLAAYLEAIDGDEAQRAARLADHARQVREHMTRLAGKDYAAQFAGSPEFVIMFLPGESVFSAAMQSDPSLIEAGVTQRVIPASPTTLIAMLKAVAYGWRQARIEKGAEQISALGRELYQRVTVMVSHFDSLGTSLGKSVEAYNRAIGSLESRVLPAARRFKDLGSAGEEPEIAAIATVQSTPRELQAPELRSLLDVVDAGIVADADRSRELLPASDPAHPSDPAAYPGHGRGTPQPAIPDIYAQSEPELR